jgi:hypothetical protein
LFCCTHEINVPLNCPQNGVVHENLGPYNVFINFSGYCVDYQFKYIEIVFNRLLRRIFGPKRDEIIGGWRKLQNEEIHNLYSSPSIIRMITSRRINRECRANGRE